MSVDQVRAIVRDELSNPALLPQQFKSWISEAPSLYGMRMPFSQIDGVYVTADTISGLGPGVHGRTGVIRGGAEPYDFLKVTYDATYGKWVSDPFVVTSRLGYFSVYNYGTYTTSNSSTSNAQVPDQQQIFYPAAAWEDAGLIPQVRFWAWIGSQDGSTTGTLRIDLSGINEGGSSFSSFPLTDGDITNTDSLIFKSQTWTGRSAGEIGSGKDFITATASFWTSSDHDYALLGGFQVLMRWVTPG